MFVLFVILFPPKSLIRNCLHTTLLNISAFVRFVNDVACISTECSSETEGVVSRMLITLTTPPPLFQFYKLILVPSYAIPPRPELHKAWQPILCCYVHRLAWSGQLFSHRKALPLRAFLTSDPIHWAVSRLEYYSTLNSTFLFLSSFNKALRNAPQIKIFTEHFQLSRTGPQFYKAHFYLTVSASCLD